VLRGAPDRQHEASSRHQDTPHLGERGWFVRQKLEALLRHDDDERCVGKRHAAGVPFYPFDGQVRRDGARRGEHAWVDVEANHAPGLAHTVRELACDHPGAAGDVEGALAKAQAHELDQLGRPAGGDGWDDMLLVDLSRSSRNLHVTPPCRSSAHLSPRSRLLPV
jgi:hypothetical protein